MLAAGLKGEGPYIYVKHLGENYPLRSLHHSFGHYSFLHKRKNISRRSNCAENYMFVSVSGPVSFPRVSASARVPRMRGDTVQDTRPDIETNM